MGHLAQLKREKKASLHFVSLIMNFVSLNYCYYKNNTKFGEFSIFHCAQQLNWGVQNHIC